MVQICYKTSKTITTVLVSEEESSKVDYKHFQISATKRLGAESRSQKISSQDVEVLPSEDFLKHEQNEINILVNIINLLSVNSH